MSLHKGPTRRSGTNSRTCSRFASLSLSLSSLSFFLSFLF